AEDGIRDFHVTGVQTCALPTSRARLDVRGAALGREDRRRVRRRLHELTGVPMTATQSPSTAPTRPQAPTTRPAAWATGGAALVALALGVVVVGAWHLTQGTSGVGTADLLRLLAGTLTGQEADGDTAVRDILLGSRLPRLAAGVTVGFALGIAGALLQSVARNALASP